jgi:hypothetical protein
MVKLKFIDVVVVVSGGFFFLAHRKPNENSFSARL